MLLLGIVRAMLSGDIGPLEGCDVAAAVAYRLDGSDLTGPLLTLKIIADEMDEFPAGETRLLWSPEILRTKDAEAADYGRRVRSLIEDACRILENQLRADLG